MGLFDSLPYSNFHELNTDWLLKTLKKAVDDIEKLNLTTEEYTEKYGADIDELKKRVTELEKLLKDVADGEYIDIYLVPIKKWIDENLITLVSQIVKYVFFGLTDDGYFAAYIPDSWNFISFDTGVVYSKPETYGHLILTY